MLPRFSVPSRRQWKSYNDTMRIYVYKISLNWLVYSLAPLIFRAHLRLEMSYSKVDFFSKGRILATIVSPCFSQNMRERLFSSSFASGTANCLQVARLCRPRTSAAFLFEDGPGDESAAEWR